MRSFTILSCVVFIVGCARAKYVQEAPSENTVSQLSYDCALQFPKSKICVSFRWQQRPNEKDPGVMIFRTFTQDDMDGFPQLQEISQPIKVVLWMPEMQHGSAPVFVESLEPATYRATNMYFTMSGLWQLKFQLLDGSTVIDEAVAPFTF